MDEAMQEMIILLSKRAGRLDASHESFCKILHILSSASTHPPDCCQTEYCDHFTLARSYFLSGLYENVLNDMLQSMCDLDYFHEKGTVVAEVFLKGPANVSFQVLCSGVSNQRSILVAERCLRLLVQICTSSKFTELIESYLEEDVGVDTLRYDSLISSIVSLPDLIANRFQMEAPIALSRRAYNSRLYRSMISGLILVRGRLSAGLPSSVVFLSRLAGKLCLLGYSLEMWRVLLTGIMMSKDFLISRVFHKLILGVPHASLESCLSALIQTVHHYEDVAALIGNTVVGNKKLEFILVDKLLLYKYFPSSSSSSSVSYTVLYNVIGYLAMSPTRQHLYHNTFYKLLSVWSDSSALRHVSFEQHMYISKALIVCSAFVTDTAVSLDQRHKLMKILMSGLQHHLSSSDVAVRHTGMAVAEILSSKLNPHINEKLKFTYDSDEELHALQAMLDPPAHPQTNSYETLGEDDLSDISTLLSTQSLSSAMVETPPSMEDTKMTKGESLDSDDDLEPLGQFDDKPVSSIKPPSYLADCLSGLMDSENPEKIEVCLKTAPQLIRAQKEMVIEIAAEFAKVLLHMGEGPAIDDYIANRHKCLVSLLVTAPEPVAEYLCNQFINRNYTVRQRLDILDSLADAALELSDPASSNTGLIVETHSKDRLDTRAEWRRVVDARVEAKTRRFAHKTQSHISEADSLAAGRFAPVAGFFFFPLLRAMTLHTSEYNPLAADSMLLVQYLNTLGKIIGASATSPLFLRMSTEMFGVIWSLRMSSDPSVKRAVMFCLAMTLFGLHPFLLVTEYQTEVAELKDWLSSLIESDAEAELREMAIKIITYLLSSINTGLESLNHSATTNTTISA